MTAIAELISVDGNTDVHIATTNEARSERDSLLATSSTVIVVNNDSQAARASIVLKDIKAFTRLVEDARKSTKEPILEQGRKIDTIAKGLVEKLDYEADRIAKVLGLWQREQQRKADEATQTAWQKERAILAEAHRGDWSQDKTEQAIIDTRVAAQALMPVKTAGMATSDTLQFEVEDVQALYDACPFMCKVEPNLPVIRAALKALQPGKTLPGVRHWREVKAIVRG
jgi:hypothetical protein